MKSKLLSREFRMFVSERDKNFKSAISVEKEFYKNLKSQEMCNFIKGKSQENTFFKFVYTVTMQKAEALSKNTTFKT